VSKNLDADHMRDGIHRLHRMADQALRR
jgi:hypothetical protein